MTLLKLQVGESTFQAFELYAVKGEPPARVAKFLNVSVSAVYVAKHRAVIKLRKIVRQLQEE